MELPHLEKLKQLAGRFETLQKNYKEFGADSKATRSQFHLGIKTFVTEQKNIFPLSAADWKLFSSMPDSPKVADALNEVAHETVEQLRIIDWNAPLAEVIKAFLNDYCSPMSIFAMAIAPKPKIHSMNSYVGVKWIQKKNEDYDPTKSWEENYRALEARYVEETSHLIQKVRELAAHLPENATLSTKTIKLIQMPDRNYAKDWKSSPGSVEIVTVADPFDALHFQETKLNEIFQTYFAPRGGRIVTMTMSLSRAEPPKPRPASEPKQADGIAGKIAKKFGKIWSR